MFSWFKQSRPKLQFVPGYEPTPEPIQKSFNEEEVLAVLVKLGIKRVEAQKLVNKALSASPGSDTGIVVAWCLHQ